MSHLDARNDTKIILEYTYLCHSRHVLSYTNTFLSFFRMTFNTEYQKLPPTTHIWADSRIFYGIYEKTRI